jgi:5-methylcytosine-specific restriction endonuclease McrA
MWYALTMRKNREEYNAYMREYQKSRYYRRRLEAIAFLGGKCVSCGQTEELEFDHVDPSDKTYNVARILTGGSEQKVREELEKCQLLCKKCHDKKTYAVGGDQKTVDHGQGSSGKRNCTCSLCKAKKAEYMKIKKAQYQAARDLKRKQQSGLK